MGGPTSPTSLRAKRTGSSHSEANRSSALAREQQAVPDGDQRRVHARILRGERVELADGARRGVVLARIGDPAVPERVVHRDDAARTQQVEAALVVLAVGLLVRVDEREIEALRLSGGEQRRARAERRAEPQL